MTIVNEKEYKEILYKKNKTHFKTCIRCNKFFNATGRGCKVCEKCRITNWRKEKRKKEGLV